MGTLRKVFRRASAAAARKSAVVKLSLAVPCESVAEHSSRPSELDAALLTDRGRLSAADQHEIGNCLADTCIGLGKTVRRCIRNSSTLAGVCWRAWNISAMALGRLGTRIPLYGIACIVPPATLEAWIYPVGAGATESRSRSRDLPNRQAHH